MWRAGGVRFELTADVGERHVYVLEEIAMDRAAANNETYEQPTCTNWGEVFGAWALCPTSNFGAAK